LLRLKFVRCMVGCAVGDALGAGCGVFCGRWTDDTHMMIGVAESLISSKGFDGNHMAQTFVKNYKLEPWRGCAAGPPRFSGGLRLGSHGTRLLRGFLASRLLWKRGGYILFPTKLPKLQRGGCLCRKLGGDRDTIGAMTGAISGAYHGLNAIPHEWLSKLEKRFYIEKLAEASGN